MTTQEKMVIMRNSIDGKAIESRPAGSNSDTWVKEDSPEWNWETKEYRVAPDPPRMTNKQLAHWLSLGFGQMNNGKSCFVYYTYIFGQDNEKVPENIRIRSWKSDRWVIPSEEIYADSRS